MIDIGRDRLERAPPRLAGCNRTIRRLPAGGAVIAVRLHGRSYEAIVADVVEGVLVASGVAGAEAIRLRRALSLAAAGQVRAA